MTSDRDIERCRAAITALRLSGVRGQFRTQADLDAQLELYARSLSSFGPAVVGDACREWAETHAVWPSLAELRALCVEVQKRRERPALQPPADLDRALNEFARYAPAMPWYDLRMSDRDGRIRCAAARAWMAAVPDLDRPGNDRKWRRQKADVAERLAEALQIAADNPGRACPGGDLWEHVCRVEPGKWQDETKRTWYSADELRRLVVEPVANLPATRITCMIGELAANAVRRHAAAGAITQTDAADMLAAIGTNRERETCA